MSWSIISVRDFLKNKINQRNKIIRSVSELKELDDRNIKKIEEIKNKYQKHTKNQLNGYRFENKIDEKLFPFLNSIANLFTDLFNIHLSDSKNLEEILKEKEHILDDVDKILIKNDFKDVELLGNFYRIPLQEEYIDMINFFDTINNKIANFSKLSQNNKIMFAKFFNKLK